MEFVNRSILIVRLKPTVFEWAIERHQQHWKVRASDKHENYRAFLTPEFDTVKEFLAWLQLNYYEIALDNLGNLTDEPEYWPQPFSWAWFEYFFDYEYSSWIRDSVKDSKLLHDIDERKGEKWLEGLNPN